MSGDRRRAWAGPTILLGVDSPVCGAVQTLESYRGRGLHTVLLAARVREAMTRNVQFVTADDSIMNRPILEKYGFIKLAEAFACTWWVKATTEGDTRWATVPGTAEAQSTQLAAETELWAWVKNSVEPAKRH